MRKDAALKNNNSPIDCTTCKLDGHHIDDQLILEINDIDDLAIAWITYPIAPDNDELVDLIRIEEDKNGGLVELGNTQWLWRKGGDHGAGKINITQWIHNNWEKYNLDSHRTLYLAIAIYDFPYGHPILKGGKWSFDAKLIHNRVVFWDNHDFGKSDTENNAYGLKYLKVIKATLNKNKIKLSETIERKIPDNIQDTIEKKYYYSKVDDLKLGIVKKEPENNIVKKSSSCGCMYLLDFFILSVSILVLCYTYSHTYAIAYFMVYNIIAIVYAMTRYRFGAMAWTLVLRKKHDKELDTFMVILGLLFTAAFGAITSFDFDFNNIINSKVYLLGIYLLYISTNVVLLYILAVISTYAVNTLKANRPLMISLIILIGIGIFIQELVNFHQNYQEKIDKIKLVEVSIDATKK